MHRFYVCSRSLAALSALGACLLIGCATSPSDDGALANDDLSLTPEGGAPQPLPSTPQPASAPAPAQTNEGGDAGSDAGSDGAVVGPQNVVIKLVPAHSDWLVAGQPAPFLVQLDAKNCNLFGNACDADVQLTLTIDVPATTPSSTPSCSRLQAGTGARQCSEGAAITRTALLAAGQEVKVRFHAEAVDDPGANPSCDVDKTWIFTGAGFTLKGEAFPATSSWQCIGGGSGQNLDVLVGYKLAL